MHDLVVLAQESRLVPGRVQRELGALRPLALAGGTSASRNSRLCALKFGLSEADSNVMATPKAASEKPRGRPRVFSEAALRQATEFSYARRVRTSRGAQDLVYRMFAVAAIELYQEAYPEKGEPLSWLLTPHRRHTLLSELGRIAKPRSDVHGRLEWSEEDVSQMISAALEIAAIKPSTKAGVARIRALRKQH